MVTDAEVGDAQRLRRVLGAPELGWLIDRIRVRLERGEPVDGTVTLVGATLEQRRAAARLLGHRTGQWHLTQHLAARGGCRAAPGRAPVRAARCRRIA